MYIKVRVTTGSKKELLTELHRDAFVIHVRENPQANNANIRVRELIAGHLEVTKTAVQIVRGHHRSNKLIEVTV